MTSTCGRTVAGLAVFTALAAGFGGPVAAVEPGSDAARAGQTVPAVGMQVAVDARGQIRQPTREEAQALLRQVEAMFAASSQTAAVTTSPDGTLSAELGDGFLNVYLARVNGDGTIGAACVDNAAAAASFLDAAGTLEEK